MRARQVSLSEMLRDGRCLIDGYAAEAGNPCMGTPKIDLVRYPALESVGSLYCFGAYEEDGTMVGGLIGFTMRHPHYADALVFFIDLFYVRPESRRTGAGTALFSSSLGAARVAGCRAIIAGAQPGTRAEKLFSRLGAVAHVQYTIPVKEASCQE